MSINERSEIEILVTEEELRNMRDALPPVCPPLAMTLEIARLRNVVVNLEAEIWQLKESRK